MHVLAHGTRFVVIVVHVVVRVVVIVVVDAATVICLPKFCN